MTNQDKSFYVYALKDPRTTPAKPFYIGKGTALRIFEHVQNIDDSVKGRVIQEIISSGQSVLETKLVENLTESEALKIEAELISAFGTIDSGGMLTNAVMPRGLGAKKRPSIVVPQGVQEKAQLGLTLLKTAVLEFVKANANGVSNASTASILGLRSDYGGGSRDYLSYSILGLLMREGTVRRKEGSRDHVAN
jgi:hypothetical protein